MWFLGYCPLPKGCWALLLRVWISLSDIMWFLGYCPLPAGFCVLLLVVWISLLQACGQVLLALRLLCAVVGCADFSTTGLWSSSSCPQVHGLSSWLRGFFLQTWRPSCPAVFGVLYWPIGNSDHFPASSHLPARIKSQLRLTLPRSSRTTRGHKARQTLSIAVHLEERGVENGMGGQRSVLGGNDSGGKFLRDGVVRTRANPST